MEIFHPRARRILIWTPTPQHNCRPVQTPIAGPQAQIISRLASLRNQHPGPSGALHPQVRIASPCFKCFPYRCYWCRISILPQAFAICIRVSKHTKSVRDSSGSVAEAAWTVRRCCPCRRWTSPDLATALPRTTRCAVPESPAASRSRMGAGQTLMLGPSRVTFARLLPRLRFPARKDPWISTNGPFNRQARRLARKEPDVPDQIFFYPSSPSSFLAPSPCPLRVRELHPSAWSTSLRAALGTPLLKVFYHRPTAPSNHPGLSLPPARSRLSWPFSSVQCAPGY